MATRIAWLLNFDADLELQDPRGYRTSAMTSERLSLLASRLTDLVAPDDVVLPLVGPCPCPADLTIQTFCPTPTALARIVALGLTPPPSPSLDILRQVNDRAFCAGLGHGLPGSCFARDMETLEAYLRTPSITGTHVIKRAFSFAGREQRRVTAGVLDASTRGFCARSFAQGEGVQVEPWVERLADFSRHGYLTRGGQLLVGPAREQRCDAMGRFQEMLATAAQVTPEEAQTLEDQVRMSGSALHAAGYFGPFGLDGFRYRTGEAAVALDPRCEINARLTMGYPRALLLAGLAAEAMP